ncbi:hypothetical protein EG328_011940 [Venturia inaequalis]|uniref:Uncharacterized protein n=1 Tax=Venturia inaequalis TaxID=5025 RepID=A0A8H3ZG66_VENIN|nr:hypothetical protein EG328_011940 [Venturia inaequalis]KAE9992082.1 hypothetical protein EG327_010183 [Venturia inaequalis]RDI79656.1 Flap endonuclease 1 [Venturia inaequalis]
MATVTTFARPLTKPLASISTRRAAARPFSTSKKHPGQQSAGKDTPPTLTPRASRPPVPPRKTVRIWPQLIGIFVGGTLLFDYMVKQRAGNVPKGEKTLSSRPFCMPQFLAVNSTEASNGLC